MKVLLERIVTGASAGIAVVAMTLVLAVAMPLMLLKKAYRDILG